MMPQETRRGKTSGILPQIRSNVFIALGSNVETAGTDVKATLLQAMKRLGQGGWMIRSSSRLYRSPAFPAGSGPDYVNAAVAIETADPPDAVLARLHAIEARMGRERTVRWGPRVIDLDLIAHGDLVLPDAAALAAWVNLPLERQVREAPDRLILPHPRMQDRAFVLKPMADIAPDWVHPLTGLSVRRMLAALDPGAAAEVQVLQ